MRLTVGGVLIILSIGAVGGYMVADKANLNFAKDKFKGLTDQAGSLVGFFKFGESDKKAEVYSPPPPFPAGATDQSISGSPSTGTVPSTTTSSSLPAVAAPTPEATPVVQVQPVKKTYRKSKRPRVTKKVVAKPKSVSAKSKVPVRKSTVKAVKKPAVPKDSTQSLMGTYVSLELITGRSVQGVLESKSGTHYILNVPGLGPLEYPIENVKTILPAQ